MGKAERALANHPGMAPPPQTLSFTACLTCRGGAENVLPGWGQGGVHLSFLLRPRLAVTSHCGRPPAPAEPGMEPPRGLKLLRFLRNRLARSAPWVPSLLRPKNSPLPPPSGTVVTSQCGRAPAPAEPGKKPPRGGKLLRFLRNRLARASRLPFLLRRKKPPPRAAVADSGPRTPAITSLLKNRAQMWPAATTALCLLAGFAVAAASVGALRFMAGFMITDASCTSWRCFLAKKFVEFLGPPLFECLSKISLKLVKFLDPPTLCEWLGLPKLSLKWLFNK